MFDDRDLIEKRIQRELWERVLPLVNPDRRPLTVHAGPDLDHLEPFNVGSPWGAPWGTTWFQLTGSRPEEWAGKRVEAVIDLGFHPNAAGFQCEGLLVERDADGTVTPLQGIHPRRTNYALDDSTGDVTLLLEAASNPAFPQFRPSRSARSTRPATPRSTGSVAPNSSSSTPPPSRSPTTSKCSTV